MHPKMMTSPVLVIVLPKPPLMAPVRSAIFMPESSPIMIVAETSPTDALHLKRISTTSRKTMETRKTIRVFMPFSPS